MKKQMDITALAGASKVQIARVYKALKELGIINTSRNCIEIIDIEKLKRFNKFENY